MKNLFKSLFFLLLVGLLFAFTSCEKEEKTPIYTGSGHPQWAPIMYKDGGEIAGAGPELVKLIMKELGLNISIVYKGQWEEVLSKTKSGEIDLLVGAYYTDERSTYMEYSIPYTEDPVSVFVKKGSAFPYNSWNDLIPKRGVVLLGDSYGEEFDKFLAEKLTTITKVGTAEEAFNLLISGNADYFIYGTYSGVLFLSGNPIEDQIEILPMLISVEKFYITISKKSPLVKYLPEINKILKRYEENGTTVAIINKYLVKP